MVVVGLTTGLETLLNGVPNTDHTYVYVPFPPVAVGLPPRVTLDPLQIVEPLPAFTTIDGLTTTVTAVAALRHVKVVCVA